jgi:hypothetical protein
MLNPQLGSIENFGNKQFIVTDKERTGIAVFGPYSEYDEGRYVVTFNLSIHEINMGHGDAVVAIIEVTACNGQTVIAKSNVYASRLLAGRGRIALDFALSAKAKLEFRVHTTGRASLRIDQERPISKIFAQGWACPDIEQTDNLLEAFKSIRTVLDLCIRERITACEESIAHLTTLTNNYFRYANAYATAGSFEIQRRSLELLRLLKPTRAQGFEKARFGSPNDGGYVMIDDFDQIDAALSFGIEQNASWDVSIADRGVPVYQFDHTIDVPPVSRSDLFFFKKRIVAQAAPGCETINDLVDRYGRPASASLILKIDIEHDEWPVFEATTEAALSCFAQIVAEFHGFGSLIDLQWSDRAQRVFEKITGQFGVVHVHANNHCGLSSVANTPVPEVLEITFANRSRYRLVSADEMFPGPFDAPNHPYLPDIHLGKFVY